MRTNLDVVESIPATRDLDFLYRGSETIRLHRMNKLVNSGNWSLQGFFVSNWVQLEEILEFMEYFFDSTCKLLVWLIYLSFSVFGMVMSSLWMEEATFLGASLSKSVQSFAQMVQWLSKISSQNLCSLVSYMPICHVHSFVNVGKSHLLV